MWSKSAQATGAGGLTVKVQLPVGAVADVRFPTLGTAAGTATITEGGKPVWTKGKFVPGAVEGITSAQASADAVVFAVTSGAYSFVSSA